MDFSVHRAMTSRDIDQVIFQAECSLLINSKSPVKTQILRGCIDYGRNHLAKSLFAKDKSRYKILSDLFNYANSFDDLHYSCFAVKQVSCIPASDNSTLRKTVLPIASSTLDTLLAPSVARMQKAFLGLSVCGLAMLLTGYFLSNSALILVALGISGYIFSSEITDYRLRRSLSLKLHQLLTRGNENAGSTIKDGLQDEIAVFEDTALNMFRYGLNMFSKIVPRTVS